jgi:hypothetical protein
MVTFKNVMLRQYAPNLKFVNSSLFSNCNPQSSFSFKIKPNIYVYPSTTSDDVITNSALAEMFVKFKWSHNDAPFGNVCVLDTNHRTFLNDTKVALNTLGQITAYVMMHLGTQF